MLITEQYSFAIFYIGKVWSNAYIDERKGRIEKENRSN